MLYVGVIANALMEAMAGLERALRAALDHGQFPLESEEEISAHHLRQTQPVLDSISIGREAPSAFTDWDVVSGAFPVIIACELHKYLVRYFPEEHSGQIAPLSISSSL